MKKEDLVGKWKLNWVESGFFPNDDLLFEPTTDPPSQYIFELKENGTIAHQIVSNVRCPAGTFTMKDGNWNYEDGLLTLELRGLKIADFWYWWKISYTVDKQDVNIFLKVHKVIKNREIDPIGTWEELIQE